MRYFLKTATATEALTLARTMSEAQPDEGWEAWVVITESGREAFAVTTAQYRNHNADDVRPL